MQAMVRSPVAPIDERVGTVDCIGLRIIFSQGRDMRIVLPQGRAGRADIREKLVGIAPVQIPHRRRQHDDVTGRLKIRQNQLLFVHP